MNKLLIIDGNNLIHKNNNLKILFSKNPDSAHSSLVEIIKSRMYQNFIIVFDGFGLLKQKNIIFSQNNPADIIIKQLIEKYYEKHFLTIITSDREIINFAKVCGSEIITSENFWKNFSKKFKKNITLNNNNEKPEKISKKELNEFKKYFS